MADAVAAYEGQGRHLTCPEPYGVDLPAKHRGLQQQRMMQFHLRFSRFDTIFHHWVIVAIDYFKKDCSASSTLPCHVMPPLDIHNYKLPTKTVFKGYFTEVELFLFSFSFFFGSCHS